MKNFFVALVAVSSLVSFANANSEACSMNTQSVGQSECEISAEDKQYPVIATTRNLGQNYSIAAVIEGNCEFGSCSIYSVSVNGTKVGHSWSWSAEAYTFSYEGEAYFFTF